MTFWLIAVLFSLISSREDLGKLWSEGQNMARWAFYPVSETPVQRIVQNVNTGGRHEMCQIFFIDYYYLVQDSTTNKY